MLKWTQLRDHQTEGKQANIDLSSLNQQQAFILMWQPHLIKKKTKKNTTTGESVQLQTGSTDQSATAGGGCTGLLQWFSNLRVSL